MSNIQGTPSIMMAKQHFANFILENKNVLLNVNKYFDTQKIPWSTKFGKLYIKVVSHCRNFPIL